MSAVAPPSYVTPRRGLLSRIFGEPNAIWMREMRQGARLGRTPWVLFGLTLSISLLMCSIGGIAASENASPASLGGGLFQAFFSLAYFVVIVVGPAVAANSVASEREGRTWEAIQLTGLHPKDITRGKFMAAYTTIAPYIMAFGLQYVVVLIAVPTLLVLVPAWFLYEITVANLTNDTDDRSSGIRRWFFCCAPLLALACALPSTFGETDDSRVGWSLAGITA